MNRFSVVATFLLATALSIPASAAQYRSRSTSSYTRPSYYQHKPTQAGGSGSTGGSSSGSGVAPVPYNAGWDFGHAAARRQFQRKTGFPGGRPGYVVDYIVPLSRGGADSPKNMRWVPIEEASAGGRR